MGKAVSNVKHFDRGVAIYDLKNGWLRGKKRKRTQGEVPCFELYLLILFDVFQ